MPIGLGPRARTAIVASVLAILALAFYWRLPAAEVEWHFLRCDNDSLLHLHQVERALHTYPKVPSFDAYAHFPRGFRIHWLAPHTFFYATLAGAADLQTNELERVLSFVPPILSLLGIALLILLARACSPRWPVAILAALLGAIGGEMVRPFFFGTIDHHLFANLAVTIAVLARLQRRIALWFVGLLLLCAMTPEAVLYASVLLGAVFLSETIAATADLPSETGAAWLLAPALAATLAWAADRMLQLQPLSLTALSWTQPTLFQPAWSAALGLAASFALRYVRGRAPSERRASAAVAVLGVAGIALVFLVVTGAAGDIVARFGGAQRLYVGEETSVFRKGLLTAHPWYQVLLLAAFYCGWRLWRACRTPSSATESFRWLILVAAFALGFSELRHLYVLAPLVLVGFSLAAIAAGDFAALALPAGMRAVAAVAVALVLSSPLLLSADVRDRAANRADACRSLPLVEEASAWMRFQTPSPGKEDQAPPLYGVFAPWTLGHQIHALGQRPVIVDPFNHVDPDEGDWVGNVIEAEWLAQSEAELVDSLRQLGARYLVLTNPADEIVSALRRQKAEVDDVYRFEPDGRLTLLPGLNRYASFRLFMSGGTMAIDGLVLRHASAATEHYDTRKGSGEVGSVDVPRLQIYELESAGATSSANS